MHHTAPSPTARLTRRRRALAAALVLASLTAVAAGCGVDSSSETTTDGKTTTTIDETTTTVEEDPPCAIEDDEAEGEVGASPNTSATCIPETTTTTVDETTTTTADPDPDPDPQPTGDEAEYVTALATGLVDLEDDDLPVTEDQAACIAPEWIDAIGLDALSTNGIGPDDLEGFDLDETLAPATDRETATAMVETIGDCGIDLEAYVRNDGLEDGQSAEEMDCFFDNIPEGGIEAVLAASLDLGDEIEFDDPAIVALGEAYETCVPTDGPTDGPVDGPVEAPVQPGG